MVDIRQPLWDVMANKLIKPKAREGSHYQLSEVRDLIKSGKVILRENALAEARKAFGWSSEDILVALSALKPSHFHKSEKSFYTPLIVLDFYKARGLKGENVYTHFYIKDHTDELVVNSFKEI